jgi:hypothetical protein
MDFWYSSIAIGVSASVRFIALDALGMSLY